MEPLQPQDPRQVGGYRLLGRLGAGGMGQVYLGVSPGGRQVAVKVVHQDLARDHDFRRRFGREVAAARTVSGAFTAPVIDAGPDASEPWLVTGYVAGPSLEQAVAEHGPMSASPVLGLAAGLAEALSAIHDAGVVHRDLKPSNVLLAPDGPRVIDFGIARAADATSITGAGFVVGSPGYMSPEQAISGEAGSASDIFSLGAVLCFAATGSGPFGEGASHALLYRVAHTDPVLDAVRDPVLRALIAACLAKDPVRRPAARHVIEMARHPAGLPAMATATPAGPDTNWMRPATGLAAQPDVSSSAWPPAPLDRTRTHRTRTHGTGAGGLSPRDAPPSRRGGRPRPLAVTGAACLAATVAAVAIVLVVLPGRPGHAGARRRPASLAASAAASAQPEPFALDNSAHEVNLLTASFAHITSRAADPEPLTQREVFGRASQETNPVAGSASLRLRQAGITADCAAAVWGKKLRQDLRRAGCAQVARGMYTPVAGSREAGRYMGMFALFNLRDNAAARAVAFALGPSTVAYDPVTGRTSRGGRAGFVVPLAGAPFDRLGGDQDNEAQAEAMGHFLLVTWAQGTGSPASLDPGLAAVEDALFLPADAALTTRDAAAALG